MRVTAQILVNNVAVTEVTDIYDSRTAMRRCIKLSRSWHLEVNKEKRFIWYRKCKNVLAQSERNYYFGVGKAKSVCKNNFSVSSMVPKKVSRKIKGG